VADATEETFEFTLQSNPPDVVIVTGHPNPSPLLRKSFAESDPAPALLLITSHIEEIRSYLELPCKSWGALSPDVSGNELIATMVALSKGLVVGSSRLFNQLIDAGSDSEGLSIEGLSRREKEVLQLVAQGMINKEIAAHLRISEHTVKFHVSSVFAKMGVTNRIEAVRKGFTAGLIHL
jgi:DNA-binding NarL/FixJ family response regulator